MTIAAHQSCFLSGTNIQFAWDSTSLGYLKTCPRKYQYIMLEGWGEKDRSVHLTFGIHYHSAIQNYEIAKGKGLTHHAAMIAAIHQLLIDAKDFNPEPISKATRYKNKETLLALTIDYFDKFAQDPAKTIILANGKPAVELSFKFELDWGPGAGRTMSSKLTGEPYEMDLSPSGLNLIDPDSGQGVKLELHQQPYLLCGHLDRVVSYNDTTFVMDHKTTTTTPGEYFFDGFNPNNQMTLYTIAGKVILDAPIKGVIIDAAQIMLEKPNTFTRGISYRTKDNLDEWLADLRYFLSTAESYAEANYWPMNDTACDKFGGCEFREICSKSPQVRNTFLKGTFDKLEPEDRWNPLKER